MRGFLWKGNQLLTNLTLRVDYSGENFGGPVLLLVIISNQRFMPHHFNSTFLNYLTSPTKGDDMSNNETFEMLSFIVVVVSIALMLAVSIAL